MFTQEMTIQAQEQQPVHLVLRLGAQQKEGGTPELPPLSTQDKVNAFVCELMASSLFESQQAFLQKWQVEALPAFKVINTKEEKNAAAEYLALLFIEVIAPAKLNRLNRERDIEFYQKGFEVPLKSLLPPGVNPKVFLAKAELADKKTAALVGKIAIAKSAFAAKAQVLEAEEQALNQALLLHHAAMQAEYLKLSSYAFEHTELQRENLLAIGQELEAIYRDLSAATLKTEEAAHKLQAIDCALSHVLANCQSTLNQRIAL